MVELGCKSLGTVQDVGRARCSRNDRGPGGHRHTVKDDPHQRYEAVYAEHAPSVLAYARRRTDYETAQDITAEVFVVVWRRFRELPAEPLPWLYGIARRVLANDRRAKMRRSFLQKQLGAGVEVTSRDRDDTILTALASLRPNDRELLMLIAWEGLSPAEAAVALGCSANASRIRLHRARNSLERALEQRHRSSVRHVETREAQ